ncbi:MAG: hypothetical protein BM561_09285 [Vibrio sp. MedPE-SWchi]|nr:MAG: hypothetical protein BM561_09285 [Vibrio sp. MedPE-SWchi]
MKWLLALLFLLPNLAFGTTIPDLTALAEKDDVSAQFELAQLYHQSPSEEDLNQAFYWYQQAANQNHPEAQFKLATLYIKGIGTEPDIGKGLFWLTKLALLGNTDAQIAIAQLYEKHSESPENLDMAEIWYSIAQPNSDIAEAGYGRVLEAKFNQRKAQQVSSLDQLDIAFESEQSTEGKKPDNSHQSSNQAMPSYLFIVVIIIAIAGLSVFLKRRKRGKRIHDTTKKTQLEATIQAQSVTIKQQKRHLETLFRQVKKLQQSNNHTRKPAPDDQKLALACAMFGFKVAQVPDQKQIKVRYKQLSKLYHPDLSGSDEEMKRLNNALKIILAKVKQK